MILWLWIRKVTFLLKGWLSVSRGAEAGRVGVKPLQGVSICLRTLLLILRIAGRTNDAQKMLASPSKSVIHKHKA